SISFHLLEEVGDITKSLVDCYTFDDTREPFTNESGQQRRRMLGEQVTDLFSWLFAMIAKVDMVYYADAAKYNRIIASNADANRPHQALRFADVIWAKYGTAPDGGLWNSLKCPGCLDAPCSCPRDLKIAWGAGVEPTVTSDLRKHLAEEIASPSP